MLPLLMTLFVVDGSEQIGVVPCLFIVAPAGVTDTKNPVFLQIPGFLLLTGTTTQPPNHDRRTGATAPAGAGFPAVLSCPSLRVMIEHSHKKTSQILVVPAITGKRKIYVGCLSYPIRGGSCGGGQCAVIGFNGIFSVVVTAFIFVVNLSHFFQQI